MEQYEHFYGKYSARPNTNPMMAFRFSTLVEAAMPVKPQVVPVGLTEGITIQEKNGKPNSSSHDSYHKCLVPAHGPTEGLEAKLLAGGAVRPRSASNSASTVLIPEKQDERHNSSQPGEVGVAPLKDRELYVGKIPYGSTEQDVKLFFGSYQLYAPYSIFVSVHC
jgi:hypothetical protein